ncbi:hypothetical protein KKA15_01540 [Patescibacteria group bacterium]|nr:hypothetical protein [Patescibacteria group bacterium]
MSSINTSNIKKSIVGLRELRENIESYISKIEKGDSFIVFKKSKPVFKISPADEETEAWEPVIDFTKLKKGGVSIKEILSRL